MVHINISGKTFQVTSSHSMTVLVCKKSLFLPYFFSLLAEPNCCGSIHLALRSKEAIDVQKTIFISDRLTAERSKPKKTALHLHLTSGGNAMYEDIHWIEALSANLDKESLVDSTVLWPDGPFKAKQKKKQQTRTKQQHQRATTNKKSKPPRGLPGKTTSETRNEASVLIYSSAAKRSLRYNITDKRFSCAAAEKTQIRYCSWTGQLTKKHKFSNYDCSSIVFLTGHLKNSSLQNTKTPKAYLQRRSLFSEAWLQEASRTGINKRVGAIYFHCRSWMIWLLEFFLLSRRLKSDWL